MHPLTLSWIMQIKVAIAFQRLVGYLSDAAEWRAVREYYGRRNIGEPVFWPAQGPLPPMVSCTFGSGHLLAFQGTSAASQVGTLLEYWNKSANQLHITGIPRQVMVDLDVHMPLALHGDGPSQYRDEPKLIIGHSYGAIYALAWTHRLREIWSHNLDVSCVTFGMPKIIHQAALERANFRVHTRVIREGDAVPNLPPANASIPLAVHAITGGGSLRWANWVHEVTGTYRAAGRILNDYELPPAITGVGMSIASWLTEFPRAQEPTHHMLAYSRDWSDVALQPPSVVEGPIRGAPHGDVSPTEARAGLLVGPTRAEVNAFRPLPAKPNPGNPGGRRPKIFAVERDANIWYLTCQGNRIAAYRTSSPARKAAAKGNSLMRYFSTASLLGTTSAGDAIESATRLLLTDDSPFRTIPEPVN